MARTVRIPRRKAIAIARYEQRSLEARAATSERCARDWARAARQARAVVEGLQVDDDAGAIDAAMKVGPAWKQAADCEGWPTPPLGAINVDVVDRYTLAHFAFGLLYGALRLPWWTALGLAVGWELVERPLKRVVSLPHGTQDSLANSTVDVVAVMAGWGAVQLGRS